MKSAALTRTLSARGCSSRCPIPLISPQIPKKLRSADIKALTANEPALLESAKPAFQKYNEEQLTVVKLSGNGKNVRRHSVFALSECNRFPDEKGVLLGPGQLVQFPWGRAIL